MCLHLYLMVPYLSVFGTEEYALKLTATLDQQYKENYSLTDYMVLPEINNFEFSLVLIILTIGISFVLIIF